jgi:hypothetical protein
MEKVNPLTCPAAPGDLDPPLKIVFAFDEARGHGSDDKSAFFALRNAAGDIPRGSGAVIVVLDTTSRISNLAPPVPKPSHSSRTARGFSLYDPIYLLPTLDLGKAKWASLRDNPTWDSAFDLKSRLYRYGRPLWTTFSNFRVPRKLS